LISIDTLRADHLPCYGYQKNTSPNVSLFREDSILFKRCLSQSPSTLTSHASIFTSLIPSHHSAYFSKLQKLPEEIDTLTERLKEHGYKCVSFNDGGQISSRFGLDQGFDLYDCETEKIEGDYLNFKTIVDKSINWIEKNQEEKFFMFLHTYETHHPYTPKKQHLESLGFNYDGNLPEQISIELIEKINRGEIQLTDEDREHIVNAYDAEIVSMDSAFGVLLDYLEKKDLYEKTLIIFTSDHGEEFGEHGIMATHSHSLYNELLHVPLIIKLPYSKYSSEEIDELVGCVDISPTLLDMLNLKAFEISDGKSFMGLLENHNQDHNVHLLAQQDVPFNNEDNRHWAIMNESWKFYDSRLFDYKNDFFEKQDVSESHLDIVKNLLDNADLILKHQLPQPPEQKIKIDKDLEKKLKSLGYIK